MKGINHLKTFGIIVLIFLSLMTVGYTMNKETFNPLPVRLVKDGMMIVEETYVDIVSGFKKMATNVIDLFHVYEENKQLKSEMYNFKALEAYTMQLEEEVVSLETMLETGTSLTSYETMSAITIMRNVDQWHDFIFINKGLNDEVKKDMAILSRNGYLIGKVIEVNEQSSKVKLIKNQDLGSKVSAIISGKENSIGIVEGYDYKTDELVMSQVSKEVDVVEGDKILTSGLGGIYPKGLLIGEVIRIEISSDGLTQTLYLKGEEHYNNMDHVIIVNREAVTVEND